MIFKTACLTHVWHPENCGLNSCKDLFSLTFDDDLVRELFAVRKAILPGHWQPNYDGKGREVWQKLVARFDADHASIDRLRLDITLTPGALDRVSFHLHLTTPGFRTTHQIYRLDIRQSGPHGNKLKMGHPLSGYQFPPGSSHEHHFQDSVDPGRCDFATHIPANVNTFDEAAIFLCGRLTVTNSHDFPRTAGQERLI